MQHSEGLRLMVSSPYTKSPETSPGLALFAGRSAAGLVARLRFRATGPATAHTERPMTAVKPTGPAIDSKSITVDSDIRVAAFRAAPEQFC